MLWRGPDGALVNNREQLKYFGRSPELNQLRYGDLSRLRNADIYAQSFGFPLAYSLEYTRLENRERLNMGRPFFPLFTGRGCPWLCSFCGGNRDTLKRVNGGGGVAWRAVARVLEDIRAAKDHGYHHVINYQEENFVERVKEITEGKGVDVVYDSVGQATYPGSLKCLKRLGMWVPFGQSSGMIENFELGHLAQHGSLFTTRPSLFNYIATQNLLV